jgi:hypothetical protein
MPTAKQIAANRANAERSTGPKTMAGKLKASRNAFQHGLSLPLRHDMAASTKADALALALAGEQASEEERMAAHEVAQAQLELVRIHPRGARRIRRRHRRLRDGAPRRRRRRPPPGPTQFQPAPPPGSLSLLQVSINSEEVHFQGKPILLDW